jgi:hypothetical protein
VKIASVSVLVGIAVAAGSAVAIGISLDPEHNLRPQPVAAPAPAFSVFSKPRGSERPPVEVRRSLHVVAAEPAAITTPTGRGWVARTDHGSASRCLIRSTVGASRARRSPSRDSRGRSSCSAGATGSAQRSCCPRGRTPVASTTVIRPRWSQIATGSCVSRCIQATHWPSRTPAVTLPERTPPLPPAPSNSSSG